LPDFTLRPNHSMRSQIIRLRGTVGSEPLIDVSGMGRDRRVAHTHYRAALHRLRHV
jgi:hypothetical protein